MSLLSLHYSDAFAAIIFDTVREPLLVLDGQLCVVAANGAFYRTFQVDPADTIGRYLYDLGDRQWDIPALRLLLEQILPEDTTVEDFEVRHTFEQIGPRVMVLNARKVLHPATKKEVVLLAIEDVTEQRESARKLRASEQRFKYIVESAHEYAIFSLDEERRVTSWNTGAERVLGWKEPEALGQPADMIFTPEDQNAGAPAREQALAAEQGSAEDLRWHHRKDGTCFWASGIMFRLQDDDGEPLGYVKILRDMTEQKHSEDALKEANEALEGRVVERTRELRQSNLSLESRNRELQDFAYVASHDLQEPLRKITTFAELIRSQYGERLDEEGTMYLERMESAAGRMSRLLNDLLSYSRVVTRGKQFTRVDLSLELRRALDDMEVVLSETGAQVESGSLPTIEADDSQIYQLFSNLVGNAVKFRKPDTSPIVQVRGEVLDRHGEPVCRLEVQDNGIGFDEKYLDRIFSPFQRLHGKSEYPGTGMGLAICQRIVERHGGTITARSRPGEGATFIVELPVRRPPAPPAKAQAA